LVALYFFHSLDGGHLVDCHGSTLTGEGEARIEALRFAGEVLRYSPERVWHAGEWRVEVTDEQGVLLFTVITSAIEAPGLRQIRLPGSANG
jgi:hypothetical protein